MNSKLFSGLTWAAWIAFIISLFLPMESHTLPQKASLFCFGGGVYCGYQNAIYFVLSPLFLIINLLQAIQTAIYYPKMLGVELNIVLSMAVHSMLGLGQVLVLLAPLWPVKIKRPSRRRLYFWLLFVSMLCVVTYGYSPISAWVLT